MYTINFFMLEEIEELSNSYIECKLNYELNLSTLNDVKSFLSSEFYQSVYDNLLDFTHGIVITDNRDDKVIYKERFNTDTLFDVYTDEEGNNIYTATGVIEDDLTNKVRINYDTLNS